MAFDTTSLIYVVPFLLIAAGILFFKMNTVVFKWLIIFKSISFIGVCLVAYGAIFKNFGNPSASQWNWVTILGIVIVVVAIVILILFILDYYKKTGKFNPPPKDI